MTKLEKAMEVACLRQAHHITAAQQARKRMDEHLLKAAVVGEEIRILEEEVGKPLTS